MITSGGIALTVQDSPDGSSDILLALRPEAVSIAPYDGGTSSDNNSVVGVVEQVVYRGFVSHTYLRTGDGETVVAFQSNRPGSGDGALVVGAKVRAHWSAASNRVVRDDP